MVRPIGSKWYAMPWAALWYYSMSIRNILLHREEAHDTAGPERSSDSPPVWA
jgi:hypothetical protein